MSRWLKENTLNLIAGATIGVLMCSVADVTTSKEEVVIHEVIREEIVIEKGYLIPAEEAPENPFKNDPDCYNITYPTAEPTEEPKAKPKKKKKKRKEYDNIDLLANCVEAEAGDQGLRGMRLVADVILNRVDNKSFPNTVEGVITQKYQFSSYWDGGMNRHPATKESRKACEMELNSRIDKDILFFTAGYYNPYCEPAYQYRDHYFGYKKGE